MNFVMNFYNDCIYWAYTFKTVRFKSCYPQSTAQNRTAAVQVSRRFVHDFKKS